MTTRKLLRIFLTALLAIGLSSCVLFKSTDNGANIDPDAEDISSSSTDDVGNPQEELLSETDDLLGSDDGEDDFEAEDDEEFSVSESDSGELDDEGDDDEFADGDDEDFDEEGMDDLENDLVDAELAGDDELDDSQNMEEASDEFVADAENSEEEFEELSEDENIGEEEFAEEPVQETAEAGDFSVEAVEQGPDLSNKVTNLAYKSFESGGTVVIETETPAQYRMREEPGLNQIIIEVDDVLLPEALKRPYIAKDFQQDIATINAYQGAGGSTARFVIQLKRPLAPIVQQEGNSILVMTGQAEGGSDQMAVAMEPVDPTGGRTDMEGGNFEAPEPISDKETIDFNDSSTVAGLPENGNTLDAVNYKGEKISIEVTGVDVRDVIQSISEQSGVNLIMDKEVKGEVTLRLRDVPWDQALMVVLQSESLGYRRQGNVIRIASQAKLSTEAQSISTQIESEKRAKLLAGGLKVKYIPVSYAKVQDLQVKLKDFTSKEGRVTFDNQTSSIVVSDYAEYLDRITRLVSAMDIPPMRVEIESKIIEAQEDFTREAGINLEIGGQQFGAGGETTGDIRYRTDVGGPVTGSLFDLSVGTFDVLGTLSASLNLFERQNKIRVLASPKVQTMNKQKALIRQVTQLPIRRVSQNAATSVTTFEFRDLELLLEVTPQITFKGDVIMDVNMKREFPGALVGDGQREINKREAKTTVMVQNGKTAVIGGIYQNTLTKSSIGVPILKDIPFIGALFRSTSRLKQKNELLVFLKPTVLGSRGKALAKFQSGSQDLEEVSVDEGGDEFEEIDTFEDEGEGEGEGFEEGGVTL